MLALTLCCLLATPSGEVRFLVADCARVPANDAATLRITSGPRPIPWPAEEIRWLFVRVAGNQKNFDRVAPSASGESARIDIPGAGAALIGIDFHPRVQTMPASDLLALAGPIKPAPTGNVRVRRVDSASTILFAFAGDAEAPPSATAVSKAGLAMEIRPMVDPTMAELGGDLPLRVYLDGSKAPGLTVTATTPSGGRREMTTNPEGFAYFHIDEEGMWRLEAFKVEPTLAPDADFVLYGTTLTYWIGEEKGR
jgi:hypothetical protein